MSSALDKAQALCRTRNSRLTPVRKRVLELIWQSHKPLGAYQILSQLAADGFNSAPPTVYRALDFLLEHGLLHRIASLNAFIGCNNPNHNHHGYFLICRSCGSAQEIEAGNLSTYLRKNASAAGFVIESETVELSGLCPLCLEQQGHSQSDK
ncbi:Fur family transcriptional regulator [Motiliproteus sp. MSK22-1]|nr:Fur family transcriptional regulator [Motiliproteus sp. MSK22-1]